MDLGTRRAPLLRDGVSERLGLYFHVGVEQLDLNFSPGPNNGKGKVN